MELSSVSLCCICVSTCLNNDILSGSQSVEMAVKGASLLSPVQSNQSITEFINRSLQDYLSPGVNSRNLWPELGLKYSRYVYISFCSYSSHLALWRNLVFYAYTTFHPSNLGHLLKVNVRCYPKFAVQAP